MSHYLYRHFNKSGKLLYVGISICALERLRQHRDDSTWFDDIATVEIERFATAKEAIAAEIVAIQKEKPLHNRAHSPKQRTEVAELVPPQETHDGRRSVKVGDAARYLGVSASLLRKYRIRGPDDPGGNGPKYTKIGNSLVIYKLADLDAWVNERAERMTRHG